MVTRFPDGPIRTTTRHGFEIVVDPATGGGLETEIYLNGTYEAGTLDILHRCARLGDVAIDVGANIGFITLFLSQRVGADGQVHAIEPLPETCNILRKNIELNGASNVVVHNVALGSRSENLRLYHNIRRNRGSASVHCRRPDDAASTEIPACTMIDLLPAAVTSRIRLIKIDVEGWELQALQGCEPILRTAHAPILCVECCQRDGGRAASEELYEFLRSVNDYRIFKSASGKQSVSCLVPIRNPRDLPPHDNLFCFLPAHRTSIDLELRGF